MKRSIVFLTVLMMLCTMLPIAYAESLCPSCGATTPDGAKYCSYCGETLSEIGQDEEPWTCAYCGAMNGGDLEKCWQCHIGRNYVKSTSASTPAPLSVEEGDTITFGHYPQTANGTDNTSIEWLVLETDIPNHKALVISRYCLDTQCYNTEGTDVTWETCMLRTWLNDTFLNKAFTAAERQAILTTAVNNSGSQGASWSANGGENTEDKVFLLS